MNKLYKSLHSYILSTGTVIISLLQQRSLEINLKLWECFRARSHIWKHNASVGRTADECVSWTHEHTKSFLSQFKPPVPGRWGACCTGQLVSDLHRAAVLASLPVCVLTETWTCAERYVQWWVQFCLLQLDRRFKGGECWSDCCNIRWRQHLPRWKQVCRDWRQFQCRGMWREEPVANLRVHSLGPNCHPRWPHLCPRTPSSSSVPAGGTACPHSWPSPSEHLFMPEWPTHRGMCEFETRVQLSSLFLHSLTFDSTNTLQHRPRQEQTGFATVSDLNKRKNQTHSSPSVLPVAHRINMLILMCMCTRVSPDSQLLSVHTCSSWASSGITRNVLQPWRFLDLRMSPKMWSPM